MMIWSLMIGIIGIIGTAGVLAYLRRRANFMTAEYSWFLGLAALAFAWLLAILALLGQSPKEVLDTPLPPSVLISSSVALLGVIFTDTINRRLAGWQIKAGATVSWFLGAAALLPAWIVALWFLR